MMYRLVDVESQPAYHLLLTYDDGQQVVFDFRKIIAEGGVYRQLENQTTFAAVSIGSRGRFIQWPGELEFCADALRLQGSLVEAQMSIAVA
jgi:hypothetical protein